MDLSEDGENVHLDGYTFNRSPDNILGEGSFGWVYSGVHQESGRPVAVKEIATDRLHHEELDSVRRLKCPFIVKYLTIVITPQRSYLVMKLYDSDLFVFLDKHGKLSQTNLNTLAKSLAQGYFAISEANIVHRDIKPQNIMLVIQRRSEQNLIETKQDGIVKAVISDFGCSKTKNEIRTNDPDCSLVGTPLYMAPEMGSKLVTNGEYAEEVDMWSIGVVLFQITPQLFYNQSMTGRCPFDEAGLCRLFLKAVNRTYVGYTAPRPDDDENANAVEQSALALKLNDVIERLLSLNPRTRLKPRAFHNTILYDHPLPGDGGADNESTSSRLQSSSAAHLTVSQSESRMPRCSSSISFKRQNSPSANGETSSDKEDGILLGNGDATPGRRWWRKASCGCCCRASADN